MDPGTTAARLYAEHERHAYTLTPREALRIEQTVALVPRDVTSIADLGAGTGVISHAIQRVLPQARIVAVDFSATALQSVQVETLVADIVDVPLPDQSLDLVVACEVIEHLTWPVYPRVLAELQRLSRRYILVTVPNDEDLTIAQVRCPECGCSFHRYRHLRAFNAASIRTLFSGFHCREVAEIGPLEPTPRSALERLAGGTVRRLTQGFPGGAMCPQCEFSRPVEPPQRGASGSPGPGSLRRVARTLVSNPILTRSRRPWLGALFERR